MKVITMSILTKEQQLTGNGTIESDPPKEQEKVPNTRNADGTFKKGFSGNYGGAPRKDQSIVERFREHEGCQSIINKLFSAANTLGEPDQHKDAISAAKLIVERLVPSLKASELRVDTDGDQGFVYLPTPEEPEKE